MTEKEKFNRNGITEDVTNLILLSLLVNARKGGWVKQMVITRFVQEIDQKPKPGVIFILSVMIGA